MSSSTTIPDLVATHAAERPQDICLIIDERRLSWGAFANRIQSVSSRLLALLPAIPGRIAIWVDDPLDSLTVLFGAFRAGAAAIPVPTLGPREFGRSVLEDCRPDCILVDAQHRDLARGWWDGAVYTTEEVLEPPAAATYTDGREPPTIEDAADVTILYSSGTTDRPKGVVHTHAARRLLAQRLIRHYNFKRSSRSLILAPLYTAAAISPLIGMTYAGGTSIVIERFDSNAFIDILKEQRPTSFGLTPTQFALLLENPSFQPSLFDSCEFVMCGGAPLDPKLRAELFRALPGKFVEGYGSTETEMITRMPRRAPESKRGSVGLPATDLKLRILGEDDRVADRAGSVGEIAVCSAANLRAYLNTSADDATYFWADPQTGERYFRTGDLGWVDEDGYVWLSGRKKDMIITGGTNIFPSDIESVVVRHDAVKEVAVVGLPHAVLGETPVAFVVPSRGTAADLQWEICRWANARLGAKQRLHEVRIMESLPRNAAGKVLKRELQRIAGLKH